MKRIIRPQGSSVCVFINRQFYTGDSYSDSKVCKREYG